MKRQLNLIPFVALLLASCATLQPGADPVVVNAERTTSLVADTFDLLLKLEYQNRVELKKVAPQVFEYSQYVRRNGQKWLRTARVMTQAYKQNRTADNKANLNTAITVLQGAASEAQKYINQAGGGGQ